MKFLREIDYLRGFPGADIERSVVRVAIAKQDLDILKVLSRNYIWDEENLEWTQLTKEIISGKLTNIQQFGGVNLTGRDISKDLSKLQNLNISLVELSNSLRGSATKDFTTLESDVESILSKIDVSLSTRAPRDDGETITIASSADISGGVSASLKNYKRWTLYINASDAIDITVELSPDNGTTWFDIPESPISFSAAGDDVKNIPYNATNIRLTGSNTNAVTAFVRGIF